jgi:hypothetical protein
VTAGGVRTRSTPGPRRDPVNDLYDHGCDLVEAAGALRRGAEQPGVARAAPAVAGCIETALRDLAEAAEELERLCLPGPGDQHAPPARSRRARRRERMRHGFVNLEVALRDAADAAAAARSLASRAVTDGPRP